MPKRYSSKGINKDRVYDFKTAARTIGVSLGTFRKYPRRGLRVVVDQRPQLVRGADLIYFLRMQSNAKKQPIQPHQLYCMSCGGPKEALGALVDYIPLTENTGRLEALCETCERPISKFSSPAKVAELSNKLEIITADRTKA